MAEAIPGVVVHHADGLHEGVHDGRADELEAAALEIPGERAGVGEDDLDLEFRGLGVGRGEALFEFLRGSGEGALGSRSATGTSTYSRETTTARILAKALNCNSVDAPTPTPCGTCDNCTSIAAGTGQAVVVATAMMTELGYSDADVEALAAAGVIEVTK